MIPFKPAQPTPWQQLQCVLMSIEGWTHNLKEGISPSDKVADRLLAHIEDIKVLAPHFKDVQWADTRTTSDPKSGPSVEGAVYT